MIPLKRVMFWFGALCVVTGGGLLLFGQANAVALFAIAGTVGVVFGDPR